MYDQRGNSARQRLRERFTVIAKHSPEGTQSEEVSVELELFVK